MPEQVEHTPMSDKVKERIEKEAIQYEDKNPYDAIHSAYYMGATTERPIAWKDAVDACRHEVALWLTEPEKLGSALMDKLEKLKHKQP